MADLSSITGLNLWVRPNIGLTAVGGRVSAWADQSGAANHLTQATAGNQPFTASDANGPYLQFEYGPNNFFTAPATLSRDQQAFSAFAVVQFLAVSTPSTFPQSLLAGGTVDYISVANGFFVVNQVVTTLRVPSSRCVMGIVSTPSAITIYCNGQTATGPALPTGVVTGGTVMADTGGLFALGSFYELGHYSRALSSAEAASAVSLLGSAYNINFAPVANVVLDGDSLTFGNAATLGQNYQRQMALPASAIVYNLGLPSEQIGAATTSASTGGAIVAGMTTIAGANVDTLYDPAKSKNILVVWGGTNDITSTIGNVSGATTFARLAAYCQARKAAHPGWYIIVITDLPRNGTGGGGGTFEADRAAMVSAILAGSSAWADAVVNLAADPVIGQPGQNNNTTNYAADGIHLNNTGYGIAAAQIKAAISTASASGSQMPISTSLSADGKTLALGLAVPTTDAGLPRNFTLSNAASFSSSSLSADGQTLTLTLFRPAFSGETPTLTYVGTGLSGTNRVPMQPFAARAVSNGSTRRAFGPPAFLNVAYPGFTWPAVAGATGYRLYQNGILVYDTVNAAGVNTATSFTDPAATDGRPIDQPTFTVSAYDGMGEGPQSGTPDGTAAALFTQGVTSVTLTDNAVVNGQTVRLSGPQRVVVNDVRYDVPVGVPVMLPNSIKSVLQNANLIA